MKFRYQKIPFQGHDSRSPLVARPMIPVYLHGKALSTPAPYYALLDSGADRVLMPAELAGQVGIDDVASGRKESTIGIAGQRADVYYHEGLSIQLLGDPTPRPTLVGFSDKIFVPILGRSFFAHFKSVSFNEVKGEIELR